MILKFESLRLKRTEKMSPPVAKALERLRNRKPLQAPARVALVSIPKEEEAVAMIDFQDGRFQIGLDDSADIRTQMETLAHEWAHALCWDVPNRHAHDAIWGALYAECYCVVFRTR